MDYFKGKALLITGGAGTLGSALVERLAPICKVIRILDENETGLFWLEQKLLQYKNLRFLIGDIKDKERLKRAVENIDIFINCAALKHVHLSEYSPFETIKSNVYGLQNCIDVTLDEYNVEKFIHISSDKAIEARGVYGVSKLLGEWLVLDAENYKGDRKTTFSVVRPVNYWKSRGSVMEVWEKQKAENKPLTVTHPDMYRYFFETLDDAVDFTLKAVCKAKGGDIFVPANVKEYRILDLAKQVSDNIVFTGLRQGEVLRHKIMSEEEEKIAIRDEDLWVIRKE